MTDQSHQPRLAPVVPGSRPALAEQEARILAARGRISPLYQVLLNSPPMVNGWEQMLSAVRNHNGLPAALRELVILRVAVLNRAAYEFDAHVQHALAAGVRQATIDAVRNLTWDDAAPLDPLQRLVLRYTDSMTTQIAVPDDLFAALQTHFDAQGMLDLTVTVAAYNMVSRLLVALHIGH